MSLASRLLVPALMVVAGACSSSPTDPRTYLGDGLRATVAPPTLSLSNESGSRILYFVVERDMAARALFCYCGLPSMEPSGEAIVAYSQIPGFDLVDDPVALIYWGPPLAGEPGRIDTAHIKWLAVDL